MNWPEVLRPDPVFMIGDLNGKKGQLIVVSEEGTDYLFFFSDGVTYMLAEYPPNSPD